MPFIGGCYVLRYTFLLQLLHLRHSMHTLEEQSRKITFTLLAGQSLFFGGNNYDFHRVIYYCRGVGGQRWLDRRSVHAGGGRRGADGLPYWQIDGSGRPAQGVVGGVYTGHWRHAGGRTGGDFRLAADISGRYFCGGG